MNLWEQLKSSVDGLQFITEWLGDGGVPVDQATADNRSSICLKCPNNKKTTWWDTAKTAVARLVKRRIQSKTSLGLKTAVDDKLHLCGICGCVLPLKVWAPANHILSHTPVEQKEKFPDFCWIKSL